MRIGFIENKMNLQSSGSVNFMLEWYNLLSKDHDTALLSFEEPVNTDKYEVRYLEEDPKALEDYNMLITNQFEPDNEKFCDALKNVKKAITICIYHDRTVIRDIYTHPEILRQMYACDYTLTYQPKFLIDKIGIDKVKELSFLTFYKDPENYTVNTNFNERQVELLYCNRTNNFKGAKLFMEWCKYLKEHDNKGIKVMKGFSPEHEHTELSKYSTLDVKEISKSNAKDIDFYTDNYGPHKECVNWLTNSKCVWVAQDYSNYPETKFKSREEYMSYLNPDLDGTTLEAIFCGCIPILHVFNKQSVIFEDNQELINSCLFYDPDKGFDELFEQYKNIDVEKALKTLQDVKELYKAKEIFINAIMLTLISDLAFEYVNKLAKEQ